MNIQINKISQSDNIEDGTVIPNTCKTVDTGGYNTDCQDKGNELRLLLSVRIIFHLRVHIVHDEIGEADVFQGIFQKTEDITLDIGIVYHLLR